MNKENGLAELKPETDEFLESLGKFLCRKRRFAGFEQADVGEMLGKNQSTISRIEAGKEDIHVSLLPVFSGLYHFPINRYFMDSDIRESIIKTRLAVQTKIKIIKKREIARQNRANIANQRKMPIAKIYLVDGIELREPVDNSIKKEKSMEFLKKLEQYDVPPFNPLSINDLESLSDDDIELVQETNNTLSLIDQISNVNGKSTLTENLIDLTIEIYQKEANRGNLFAQRICKYISMSNNEASNMRNENGEI